MYVQTEDVRPPTVLRPVRADSAQLAGGALLAVLVPASVALAAMVATVVSGALGPRDQGPAIDERHVVEAHFVRLGKPPEPHRLPNRVVPQKATAPDDKVVVSDNPKDHPEQDAGVKPPHAVQDDLLRNVLGSANKFAEIAEQRELEGSPDGIAEGSATAQAGDIYAGKLYQFFRRGWTVPTTISDKDRQSLVTEVDVKVGSDLSIADYRIRTESGNPLFDQSVLDDIRNLQSAHAKLPEPPPVQADQILGHWIGLNFRGRDAN